MITVDEHRRDANTLCRPIMCYKVARETPAFCMPVTEQLCLGCGLAMLVDAMLSQSVADARQPEMQKTWQTATLVLGAIRALAPFYVA
eukprot:3591642-Prymnesium_polylepis.1